MTEAQYKEFVWKLSKKVAVLRSDSEEFYRVGVWSMKDKRDVPTMLEDSGFFLVKSTEWGEVTFSLYSIHKETE